MVRKDIYLLFFISMMACSVAVGQSFKEITILSDTSLFSFSKNSVQYDNANCFFVKANGTQQIFEVTLYPDSSRHIKHLQFIPTSNVAVVDSIVQISNNYFRGRFKLKDSQHSGLTNLLFAVKAGNESYIEELKLFPYFETTLLPGSAPIELYAGEEKTIEIPAINASNLKVTIGSGKGGDSDYLIRTEENSLNIKIHPTSAGNRELTLNLKTIAPFIDASGKLSYDLDPSIIHLVIKPSRLNFINSDKSDFFFDNKDEAAEEVQFDQKGGLEPGKMYRIENQLEPGGKLIAEIYIKSAIGDNKILCSMRPYSYHKVTEGHLYIKLGNEAKYITNFNILQKPSIENISVLHEGEEWSPLNVIHPGENIQIKIEGKGLSKARFLFSNCNKIRQDSSRVFDDVVFYSFSVPADINKKVVYVEMNRKRTKYELAIKENQRPKDFDFILANYGTQNIAFSSVLFNKPVVESHTLKDINISFNSSGIDTKDDLYGKQYLDFEFKIYNNKNDLLEDQRLENIVICPDDKSARGSFYDRKDCFKSVINVNDYLLHKTYDLDGWSKVEITVRHSRGKYSEPGYTRRIIIIKHCCPTKVR